MKTAVVKHWCLVQQILFMCDAQCVFLNMCVLEIVSERKHDLTILDDVLNNTLFM